MKIRYLCTVLIAFTFISCVQSQEEKKTPQENTQKKMNTLHSFTVKTIDGQAFDMATLKGKKVLVVNTASECGFTPQYAQLQELYESYGGASFEIVAFPSNDFGGQEPGSHEEIASFCSKNFGVTFPLMEKITVKGSDIHPVYAWLSQKDQNGKADAPVSWNFQKFLIDEQGEWVASLSPRESPISEKVIDWLKEKN